MSILTTGQSLTLILYWRYFRKNGSRRVKNLFMNEKMENKEQFTLSDEDARLLIQKCTNERTPLELKAMKKVERDAVLRAIKKIQGISTRQIARITGISQSIIARA